MAFGFGGLPVSGQDDGGFSLSPDMLAAMRSAVLAQQSGDAAAVAPQAAGAPFGLAPTPAQQQPAGTDGQASAAVTLPMISADAPRQQAGSGQSSAPPPASSGAMTDQQALIASAQRLGLSPVEWGGIIHYESGADPSRWGGTGGRHVGLIQFGPNEQKQFGVTGNESFQDQLLKAEAFMSSRGYKPGMGVMNAYSTINAGSPGHFNASDAGNRGMPGTVADKVNNQFAPHYAWANKFLGGGMQLPASAGGSSAPAAFGLGGVTQTPGAGTVLPAGGGAMATPNATASDGDTTPSFTDALKSLGGMGGADGKGGQSGQKQQSKGGGMNLMQPARPRPFSFLQPMQFAGQRTQQPAR
ncbi:hypothetical protein [Methylobacterium sp. NEAU K]|uniref:hypothetical protein n=1 Tax=Methylobacterium sp. NEAU K TaxID=3064946 RepID=UPI0027370D16|nr:hypothetical protein [Methylobacterium sp. NEAU K]MDP4005061.1 hypothetical protein [Methylobacterium sp. NEAU K]